MAFQDPTFEGVSAEIRRRQTNVGRLSFVQFDDSEYQTLLTLSREIIHHYIRWRHDKQQKARGVFLALAFEYVRRNKYVPDNVFWDQFETALGTASSHRSLIMDELLWRTYGEENVQQQRGEVNRLIVRSLISEVWDAPEIARRQFIDFFRWYYENYAGLDVTPELVQEYKAEANEDLVVVEKAVPALNRDCQTLTRVIDYAIEHNLSLARADFESYRVEIVRALGEEYDPARMALIRGEHRALRNLIIELENHRTPAQFLRELERNPNAIVHTPTEKQLPAHLARRRWQTRDLEFGLYRLDEDEYRVVPLCWLRLESINRWPYGEVIHLRRKQYLGYKKKQSFEVKAGDRAIRSQRYISRLGDVAYIWAGHIPLGERFVIDGHPCQEAIGLSWSTSLRLGYDEEGDPLIVLTLDRLVAFFPRKGGSRLLISTSQGYERVEHLRLDGSRCFHRAIAIPLESFLEPLTVSIYLEEKVLDNTTFEPEPAYLFSYQTHERILAGTETLWGEAQYLLFSSIDIEPRASEGVKVESLNTFFDVYSLYRVIWEDSAHPLHLVVGDKSWHIQRQSYFLTQVEPHLSIGAILLARHQIHCFEEAVIRVWSNIDILASRVVCKVLQRGELINEALASACLESQGDDRYVLAKDFLVQTDAAAQGRYGQYDFMFSSAEGRILEQITLAVVPEISVSFSCPASLLPEGAAVDLEVQSPHLEVWDPLSNQVVHTATLQLYPKLSLRFLEAKDNVGIPRLTLEPISTSLIWPTINETVKIRVCPDLFGVRLYQLSHRIEHSGQNQPHYWQVDQFDFYSLDTAMLYIVTAPNHGISLSLRENVIWCGQSDSEGHAIVDDLSFLKPYCQQEVISCKIVSGGLEHTFSIRWTPLVHKLVIADDEVHVLMSGPPDTGVILRFVELGEKDEIIRFQHRIACNGEHLEANFELPSLDAHPLTCYLIPIYQCADGTLFWAARQWRVEISKRRTLPVEWPCLGIGLSNEADLEILSG